MSLEMLFQMIAQSNRVAKAGLLLTLATSLTLLSGCDRVGTGGGNGGDDIGYESSEPSGGGSPDTGTGGVILYGKITDVSISGLKYVTATQAGLTNAEGEFRYIKDEMVDFYFGDVLLGQAVGADLVTPFDLAGVAPPITALETRHAANLLQQSQPNHMHRLVNLSLFLQTFDLDADPSNGIEIPMELHDITSAFPLDFEQNYNQFYSSVGFRSILSQARDLPLWDFPLKSLNPLAALNQLYAALNIEAEMSMRVSKDGGVYDYDFDYDNEGHKVREVARNLGTAFISSSSRYVYDDNDNVILEWIDDDLLGIDGNPDELTVYVYDEYNRLVRAESDSDADGNIDSVTSYTYNDFGYISSFQYDDVSSNIFDFEISRSYFFDAEGRIEIIAFDVGDNGEDDYYARYTYDDIGNLIQDETFYDEAFLYDGSGYISKTEYAYDALGNRTNLTYVILDSVNIGMGLSYRFDNDNNIVSVQVDNRVDGDVDGTADYALDENDTAKSTVYDSVLLKSTVEYTNQVMPLNWKTLVDFYDYRDPLWYIFVL